MEDVHRVPAGPRQPLMPCHLPKPHEGHDVFQVGLDHKGMADQVVGHRVEAVVIADEAVLVYDML